MEEDTQTKEFLMHMLGAALLKIVIGIPLKLVTERFISKVVVIGLKECSRRTANKWDDELVVEMERAVGDARAPAVSP